MTMTSTTISTVETAIATTLGAISGLAKVYTYEPISLDTTPCVTLWAPDFDRGRADENEAPGVPIGRYGVRLTWELTLWVRADTQTADAPQTLAKQLIGQIIGAVDASPNLGVVTLRDARVEKGAARLLKQDSTQRMYVIYECELSVLAIT